MTTTTTTKTGAARLADRAADRRGSEPVADRKASASAPAGEPAGGRGRWVSGVAAALAAAERGWHVFPLVPGGKAPAVRAWEQRATTDPDRIRRCWSAGAFGIGIACGPSGLLVVDLDTPKTPDEVPPEPWRAPGFVDGCDVYSALAGEHGDTSMWATRAVSTPHGGRHLYYRHPDPEHAGGVLLGNSCQRLGWGIDTRGHGGFVVAPGTVLRPPALDTRRMPQLGARPDVPVGAYAVEHDATVHPLPAWVTARLLAPATPAAPSPGTAGAAADEVVRAVRRRSAYAGAVLRGEVDRVLTAPPGTRNHTLNAAAYALGRHVARGLLPEDLVTEALHRAGAAAGLTPAETAATTRSGLTAARASGPAT
jgi:hypothetical protein